MIVGDTNLFVAIASRGEAESLARQVFEKSGGVVAPALMRYEFAQWLGAKTRTGKLSLAEAAELAETTLRGLTRELLGATLRQIVETARRHTLSSYDASFVFWAERLRVPLVTQDLRLVRAAPEVAVTLGDYLQTV